MFRKCAWMKVIVFMLSKKMFWMDTAFGLMASCSCLLHSWVVLA